MNSFDTDLLKHLQVENVLAFLEANGWVRRSRQKYSTVWELEDTEVLVPAQGTRDYYPRIHEVLSEIALAVDTSIEEVFRKMLMSGFERLKVSAVGPGSKNGTVSFDDGAKLLSNIRELLLSSASSVVEPRRVYHGRRPDRATTFMNEARLGQTEHGSFVMTVLAPVMKDRSEHLPGIDPPPPYGSQVLKTLLNATSVAADAAAESFDEAEWFDKRFVPLVEKGVSANLCSALSGMLEVNGTEKVTLTASLSDLRSYEAPIVEVPTLVAERLSQAASEFRKDPPLEGVYVEGKAISFRRESVKKIGKVSLKGIIGGESRRITFSLPTVQYNLFLEAHKEDHPISFVADLKKAGTSYEATDIRELRSGADQDLFIDFD